MTVALFGALLLAVIPAGAGAGQALEPAVPLRVLIVGDSVTQGSAGDWTWRYRLWQHLTAVGTDVDFVGPRDDLWDNLAEETGSHDYVDPDFDTDHAARWGATLEEFPDDYYRFDDLVADYRPDVVLEMFGINDLAALGRTPVEVSEQVRDFVATVRGVDPDIDVVLGHLTQTWYPGVSEFNTLLDQLAVDVDDPAARVVTAAADEGYTLREDTWDPAHPNARGEVRVAAAMADALAVLGLADPYPRPLAEVPRGPRMAAELEATAEDGAATLAWSGPPGADHEVVWLRDVTAGDAWRALPDAVAGTSYALDGLTNGDTYEVALQPVKGYWAAEGDIRSNVVAVRPLPPRPGQVVLRRVWSPRRDRVRVRAAPVPGASSYRLDVAPGRSCAGGRHRFRVRVPLTGPRGTYVTSARRVRVRLVALNDAGPGAPSAVSRCLRVR